MLTALQAKFTHRMSHGVQFQASYTWSHAIDDSSDPLAPAQGNRTFPRNSRDLSQERGNSDNDVRHAASVGYIWELPFGRGKGYASHGALGRVLEGFQISGITRVQTGHPFEIRSRRDSQRTGISAWGDLVGDPFAAGSNVDSIGEKAYFTNPDAFATPAFGGPGNIGRNQFYGPGYSDVDLSVFKNTTIKEKVTVQFRAEMFNLFNRANFAPPAGKSSAFSLYDTIGDYNGAPGIGAGEPFNTQLVLKILF